MARARFQSFCQGDFVANFNNAQKPRDFISSLDTQDGDKSPRFEVKNWWFDIFPHELQIAD